jgi:hypothetical protein
MHEKYREIRRSGIGGVEERYTKMQRSERDLKRSEMGDPEATCGDPKWGV